MEFLGTTGRKWRRLDALDQLRHLPLECVGWPERVVQAIHLTINGIAAGLRNGG
ncbi:MAG TPA: hypothetical protein VF760_02170 [Xanthobacteraceae bacterium]